jgi:hypothetical protein
MPRRCIYFHGGTANVPRGIVRTSPGRPAPRRATSNLRSLLGAGVQAEERSRCVLNMPLKVLGPGQSAPGVVAALLLPS